MSRARYWPRRVCLQMTAVWLGSSILAFAAVDAMPAPVSLEHALAALVASFVAFVGAVLAVLIKWVRSGGARRSLESKREREHTMREDYTTLDRIERRIGEVWHGQESMRQHLGDVRERVARIEGRMEGLQCIQGECKR